MKKFRRKQKLIEKNENYATPKELENYVFSPKIFIENMKIFKMISEKPKISRFHFDVIALLSVGITPA